MPPQVFGSTPRLPHCGRLCRHEERPSVSLGELWMGSCSPLPLCRCRSPAWMVLHELSCFEAHLWNNPQGVRDHQGRADHLSGAAGWVPAPGCGLYPHCWEEGRSDSCIRAVMLCRTLQTGSTPACYPSCEGTGLFLLSFIPSPFAMKYIAGHVGIFQVFPCEE